MLRYAAQQGLLKDRDLVDSIVEGLENHHQTEGEASQPTNCFFYEDIDRANISSETLESAYSLLDHLAVELYEEWQHAMLEVQDKLPASIKQSIEGRNMHLPSFTLLDCVQGNKALGLSHVYQYTKLKPDELLLIFDLPHIFDQGWNKKMKGIDVNWPIIYKNYIDHFWAVMHIYSNISMASSTRINEKGHHTEEYYYLFSLSKLPAHTKEPTFKDMLTEEEYVKLYGVVDRAYENIVREEELVCASLLAKIPKTSSVKS